MIIDHTQKQLIACAVGSVQSTAHNQKIKI